MQLLIQISTLTFHFFTAFIKPITNTGKYYFKAKLQSFKVPKYFIMRYLGKYKWHAQKNLYLFTNFPKTY